MDTVRDVKCLIEYILNPCWGALLEITPCPCSITGLRSKQLYYWLEIYAKCCLIALQRCFSKTAAGENMAQLMLYACRWVDVREHLKQWVVQAATGMQQDWDWDQRHLDPRLQPSHFVQFISSAGTDKDNWFSSWFTLRREKGWDRQLV